MMAVAIFSTSATAQSCAIGSSGGKNISCQSQRPTINISHGYSWTASESTSWITNLFYNPSAGIVRYSASKNNTGSARTGSITITSACGNFQNIQITQSKCGLGGPPTPIIYEYY